MTIKPLPQDVGNYDRVMRVVLGLVLLSFALVGPQSAWGYLGFLPLVTGLIGTCPLYMMLGISTCPLRTRTH